MSWPEIKQAIQNNYLPLIAPLSCTV